MAECRCWHKQRSIGGSKKSYVGRVRSQGGT